MEAVWILLPIFPNPEKKSESSFFTSPRFIYFPCRAEHGNRLSRFIRSFFFEKKGVFPDSQFKDSPPVSRAAPLIILHLVLPSYLGIR